MRIQLKYSIVCGLLLTTYNSVVAQFNAYANPCGDTFDCNQPVEIDFCRCGVEDSGHTWNESNYQDLAGDVDAFLFAQNVIRKKFDIDFKISALKELEERYDQDFPTFRHAQIYFFERWNGLYSVETPGFDPPDAYKNFNNETRGFMNNFQLVTTDLSVLEFRRNEIENGNINYSEVSSYTVEGMTMGDIKTIKQLERVKLISRKKWDGLNDHLNPILNTEDVKEFGADPIRANLVEGAKKLSYERMLNKLADQYVREYEKFNRKIKNKMDSNNQFRDFMIAATFEAGQINPLIETGIYTTLRGMLLYEGDVYLRSAADVAYREARRLGTNIDLYRPEPTPIESVMNEQVFKNLGNAANKYISKHQEVRRAIQEYFEHYEYNDTSQDCINYLFQNVLGEGNFAPDISDYDSNQEAMFRSSFDPNVAVKLFWKPRSIGLGYQGFQNVLAALNNIPENHGKMGYIIRDIFRANGKELPTWMDDELIGRFMQFTTTRVDSNSATVEFRDGFGSTAYGDGLTTDGRLYRHIQNVDFIKVTLELDTKEQRVLLRAANFATPLFDFIKANLGNSDAIDFANSAVDLFTEGGEVNFDCDNPKPGALEFCKKVWYLDKDGDGFYSATQESETSPGKDWYENLTEKDCDDSDAKKKSKGDCFNINDPCANKDLRNKKVTNSVKSIIDQRTQVVTVPRGGASNEKSFKIQEIEDGRGDINVDKYELVITELPEGMTAQQLFEDIRKNFFTIVTGGDNPWEKAKFMPYTMQDRNNWLSTNPLGSAMDFETPFDTATVIVTEYSLENMFWTFTTVTSLDHLGHPVNGHRQFRLRLNEDGSHTFVVRGADRLATPLDAVANKVLGLGGDFAFDLADGTWKNLMKTIENFIKSKPGAKIETFNKNDEYGKRFNYNEKDCKD